MPSLGCSEHRRAIRASGHDVLHRRNDSCLLKAGAAGVATGAFCEGTDVRAGKKNNNRKIVCLRLYWSQIRATMSSILNGN